MPSYVGLKRIRDAASRKRTARGLQRLRAALSLAVPPKMAGSTLLLATWNIREFDAGRKASYRTEEAYHCIAEVLSRFDLIAVQEVSEGLYALQKTLQLLGPDWAYLVTDVTLGAAGNSERMAFVYDRRNVTFSGLAAELVLPKEQGAEEPVQLARSPYVCGFRAGWAWITLATVHIYYGDDAPVDPRRLREIKDFARTLAKHAGKLSSAPQYKADGQPQRDNLLMLGDFNIFNRGDVTMEAITAAGFRVPDALQSVPGSNVAHDKHYDQIAYYKELKGLKPTGRAGVFDVFDHVFRLVDEPEYAAERVERPGRSFKEWRTFRISDHLPMWAEFGIDDADAYLAAIAGD